MTGHAHLTEQHYHSATRPAGWMRALAWGYGQGVALRNTAYDAGWLPVYRPPVLTISMGNLTAGGTGKTPLTIQLVTHLEAQGYRAAIIARNLSGQPCPNGTPVTGPIHGDEAFLIQQHCTQSQVFVGPHKATTAKMACQTMQPDIMVIDDGFQHRALARDIDVLLVDGSLGWGNQALLPAGPLREPLSQIKRATHLLLTKTITPEVKVQVEAVLQPHQKSIPVLEAPFSTVPKFFHPTSGIEQVHSPQTPSMWWAVAGISQPHAFFNQAKATGLSVLQSLVFDDHHRYQAHELSALQGFLGESPQHGLITTGKDWVKLAEILPQEQHAQVWTLLPQPQLDWTAILSPYLPVPKGAA